MSEKTSNNKKKIILVVIISALILLTGIAAFLIYNKLNAGFVEVIGKAENTYEKEYHSFCTLEHDADIKIDGVLDEEVWQGKNWFSNTFITNHNGNMPVMKVTGFTTEYGVYLATVVEDENIVNNGQRSSGYNSMFEFEVTADNVGENRVNDGLYRTKYIIDMRADCISRDPNVDRAVVVEGELNSKKTKSATLELFIPWENLMIDTSKGVPEEFRVLPSYRAVLLGDERTTMILPVVYSTVNTRDFYRFGESGYMTPDREGAVVGNTKFGNEKTGNWDVTKEAQGIVQSSYGSEHHKIFFSEEHGSSFIVKSTIVPVKAIDNFVPYAGIYFHGTDTIYNTIYHSVFLNMHENNLVDGKNGTKNVAKYQLSTLNNVDNKWNQKALLETYQIENSKASSREGVELTVVKYDDKFWYFADGEFLTQEVNEFISGDVIPGFYAMGADAIFKDYSCEEVDSDAVKKYLEKEGLYLIDAKTKGKQGSVTASAASVKKGGSYDITIKSKSGYRVSSVIINGKEMIKDVKKNANGGVYTVKNVNKHQEVVVAFEKVTDGVKFSGKVTNGTEAITADVAVRGLDDKSLFYFVTSSGEKGFNVTLPKGNYRISVTATDYKAVVEESVSIKKDREKTYKLTLSDFPTTVEVNGKKLGSNRNVWNLANEHKGIVSGSFANGTKNKPLYFRNTAKDFVAEFTAKYTTNFVEGVSYQPDLMAGFLFHDGTNEGWILARTNGLVTTGWNITTGLIDESVLMYPDKKPVKFAVAKKGNEVYVYMNGEFAYKMDWSRISSDINPNSEVAIGLMMIADKTADVEISNYKLSTGTKVAEQYIKERILLDEPIDGSSVLAKRVTVNGVQLKSMLARWDLSEVSKNIVKGSYAMGSKMQPLYFTKAGSTALVSAKFEYTTDLTGKTKKELENYQPDLMGGFAVSDGKDTAHIVAASTGIIVINPQWNFKQGLINSPVLHRDYGQKPVEMSLAIKDKSFYVFLDGGLVATLPIKEVLPNTTSSNLAMGITMVADKTADIRVSNVSQTTDANAVAEYIKKGSSTGGLIEGSTVLAKGVSIGGVVLKSAINSWDLSEIEKNIVKGSYAMGSRLQPLYFAETGSTALIGAKFEYTTDLSGKSKEELQAYQPDLMGGFTFSDGKNSAHIVAASTGIIVINPQWTFKQGLISTPVLHRDYGQKPVEMAVAIKDNSFYIYLDDDLVATIPLKEILPNATSSNLAMGIMMMTDKTSDIRISELSQTTDAAKVEAFLNKKPLTEEPIDGSSLFAKYLTVNGTKLSSFTDKWDLSELAQNVVKGSTEMGSSYAPLYFMKAGNTALMSVKIEYTTDLTNVTDLTPYERILGGGFVFSDGKDDNTILTYGNKLVNTSPWKVTNETIISDASKWVLMKDNKLQNSVVMTIALKNNQFYVYYNDELVKTYALKDLLPNAADNTELAMGITMAAYEKKIADIKYSNISYTTDATAVDAYIKRMEGADKLIDGSSLLAQRVTVNGVQLQSAISKWDLSEVSQNVVKGSYAMGSRLQPIYFMKTGSVALVNAKFEYTTQFVDGNEYERALGGGFVISDGTNTAYVLAYGTGIIIKNATNSWNDTYYGLLERGQAVLMSDIGPQTPVELTAALKDNFLYMYFDGVMLAKIPMSEILPNATSSTLAIGVTMLAEKTADIKISNLSISTDAAEVAEYIKNDVLLFGSPFAKSVTVNGVKLNSAITKWDMSELSQNIVKGSFAMGSKLQPLYFAASGENVMMSTKLEYTTDFTGISAEEKENYQKDLMGGFTLSDGTNTTHLLAWSSGLQIIKNNVWSGYSGLLDHLVLRWDYNNQCPVEMTVVIKGTTVNVFLDDALVKTFTLSELGLNTTSAENVAKGIVMVADKSADIKFSEIVHTTDTAVIDAYMNSGLFTGKNSITLNGKTVASAIANWDFTKVSQAIVEGTSPTNRNSPIYLAKTGKTVLVSATIEYTSQIAESEKSEYQEILKAGYMLHDGTDSAYIMARGTGYEAHAFKTNQKKADAYGKIDYVALNRDHGQKSVKLTLALKDNVVKVYMNDNLVGSHTLADLGLTNDADVAMGLYIYTDYVASTGGKKADIRYSDIVHTTDATEVDAYINAH